MKHLIKNARLFDPGLNLDRISDLLIENGRIKGIGKNLVADEAEVLDLSSKIVVPGFLDMHVHLREPGQEDKETVETGARAAARGGFTGVACMPNTNPPIDNVASVHFLVDQSSRVPVKIYPIACVSKGRQGEELTEMARLKEAGAVGFSDDGKPVKTARLMRHALEYGRMLGTPVVDHCEEETMAAGDMHEGYYSTILGLEGIPSEAETIAVARDLALAELTQGKIHIAHVSSAESVELIRRAKSRGIAVTAEATIHHLLLTHEALTPFDTNCKINPPLRTETDRKALVEGLKDRTIDCIVSDHAPHTREEKEREFKEALPGISGIEVLVPLVLSEMVKKEEVSLRRVVEALSLRPYEILGLKAPHFKEGEEANFTVLDLEAEETIRIAQFESKGKNCPYEGKKVTGLPVMAFLSGRFTMRDRRILAGLQDSAQLLLQD